MAKSITCNTLTVKNGIPEPRYGTVMDSITERLIAAFAESGMGQVEFAKRAGVSKQTVNGWLKGRVTNIRPDNLFAASDALSINARWLATGHGPKSASNTKIQARLLDKLKALDPAEAQALSESFISIAEAREKYSP